MNSKTVKLGEGFELRVKFKGLPEEFDVDRVLKIDYANIPAEASTIPILMNNIGFILAECENNVRISELELKKTKAILAKQGREIITEEKNGKPATNDETLEWVRRQPKYDILNRKFSKAMETRDIINSIYWSIKSKQELVQNLSRTINHEDFNDMLKNTQLKELNYVSITQIEPLVK